MTDDVEEAEWLNERSWFGSLINAQKYNHEVIMAANRERIPMIIEYLIAPVDDFEHTQQGYLNSDNRRALTMYINPNRLQFNNQKVIGESITRGGVFYHHWGDKPTVLSLSGDLGLSSMSGVKKLDEIYRMSGVLLAYGENMAGPVYTDGNTDFMNDLASGNWMGALTNIISGKVSLKQAGQAVLTHTIGAAQDAITGRVNTGLQSSKIAGKVATTVGKGMEKIYGGTETEIRNNPIFTSKNGNQNGLTSVANTALNTVVNKLGEKIGNKLYKKQTSGALDYLDQNVVTFEEAFGGFSDIVDELEDPWRPRLIWIYFEDHVFIGHFQSFNYNRDAASVNIHYEMSFVIQREIILTSYQPTLPGLLGDEGESTNATGGKFLANAVGLGKLY